jgi:transposase
VIEEVVADKGYHSNAVMSNLSECGVRSYVSEPDRGRRCWTGGAGGDVEQQIEQRIAQRAVYGNRRRIRGARGKRLMRRRGEIIERSFAHCYDTGGMRRTHLRHHGNILKRLLIHVAGFNLSLVLRAMLGIGTARGVQERMAELRERMEALRAAFSACAAAAGRLLESIQLRIALRWSREALNGRKIQSIARLAA